MQGHLLALAGGVGGAKLAIGLSRLLPPEALTIVVNTGDDDEFHGLHVSPDLDTVMYTLAGLANHETGWGVRDETWSAAAMIERYGGPTWFSLGDRDLATHILRTAWLSSGNTLTEVTRLLSSALGVRAQLLPMADSEVHTRVRTADGWLDFQDYFVRRRHADEALEVRFDGIEAAQPTEHVLAALEAAGLIVIAPSNPFVSVGPILSVPGMAEAVRAATARVIAVSPIIGGAAVRGPADAMLRSLAGEHGAAGVARHYARAYPGLIDEFVLDGADAAESAGVAAAGLEPFVTGTLLASEQDRRQLAAELIRRA